MMGLLLALATAQTADRNTWIDDLGTGHGLTAEQVAAVRAIAAKSDRLGQGLPGPTVRPMTGLSGPSAEHQAICGQPWMVPLYDPAKGSAADATTCIDQFEFPGLPCTYPVVWVRASEASAICRAVGKRLCDAHEWEGACAGSLGPPDYPFEAVAGKAASAAQSTMRASHNAREEPLQSWATGPQRPAKGVCAQGSTKSTTCDGSDPKQCGSNTYPTGAFPGCVSPLGVYDQHGNAAEHMNLPLTPAQMTANGGLGVTEMKGSWFIFDSYYAHEDWCRWRAPYWHGGEVQASDSHRNYHLGFRCCSDVKR